MPSRSLVRVFRRAVPLVAGVLVASVVSAAVPQAALAADGEPSVPLPTTPSTQVFAQSMTERPPDEASDRALTGPQEPRSGKEGSGVSTATPLSPSATWDVSAHTGDFAWSYPFRVPPAPGGLEPNVALSYRSSTVDGRTSVTNNQPSWAGDGWELSPGFVERSYGGCADDTDGNTKPPVDAGDLCWRSDNAIAAYAGGGGQLICCDADKKWRAKSDDGSRIERRVGMSNGDNDGEHWVITTVDGTQYWFGSQTESDSTWTVPVFGDDDGEPCYRPGSFDASHCPQAWRWLLDKIVDRNGNEIRYYYKKETNSYGFNRKDAAVSYVRGGTLDRIEYGLRPGVSGPSARVLFGTLDRCVPGSTCSPEKPESWPDTNWESRCNTSTCKDKYSPTFWTTQRLSTVTTQVLRESGMSNVDKWELDHQFPDPGDGEKAALWLKGITHTGLVNGSEPKPAVSFIGTGYDNRVDTSEDGVAPLRRFRITGVVSETGGMTSVQYSSQCRPDGPMPNKDRLQDNTLRCFPVRWNQKNHADRVDFFHKYVVATVAQSDRLKVKDQPQSTFPEHVTSYEYLDGAGWHWDTSEFVKEDKKTWNEFRGFGRVRVRTGTAKDPAGGVTMTEQRFYRGMNGDKSRPETQTVKDSEGGVRTDEDWLSGYGFESATFEREGPSDKEDPSRIAKTITEPVWQGPTATRAAYKAYIVGEGVERGYTLLANKAWRTTRTDTTYDNRGLPEKVDDFGDIATADDDRCSRTTYDRKTDKWLLSLPARVETVSVHCKQDAVFPTNALSDTKFTYDGNGNATTVQVAKDRPAAGASYVTAAVTTYDDHGRPTSVKDALGHTAYTAYTPKVGGPLTKTVSTSPPTPAVRDGLVTTTDIEPAWGVPKLMTDPNGRATEIVYDASGRKTKVWLPNWTKSDHPNTPGIEFGYLIRNDAPTVVTTSTVGPNGIPVTSKTLYDGLLRPRQVQKPAMGGGRLLTDTRYDSQGRVWKSTQPYFNNATVDNDLWVAADTGIPGHTRAHFDDAGRPDESMYYAGAHEKWRTSTRYDGDRIHVTPPAGATATTTISDARGQTVELRQYHGPKPEGGYDATTYTHSKAGLLETVTDPARNVWRFDHDLRGLRTTSVDPDRGTAIMSYDDVGQLSTVRKPATNSTLAYSYDALGRKTGTYVGEVGATLLAEWTYDTVGAGKGQPATTTRLVDGNAYTSTVLSYDPLYQPTGLSLTIPTSEGLLARTYTTAAGYNPDGSLAGESFAAAGELPEEEVNYRYHDLGPLDASWGGFDGETTEHVNKSVYTRYGELARMHLGKEDSTNRGWLSYYYDTSTRRLNRSIVDVEVPSPMQADVNYTYDHAGTITSIADTRSSDVDIQCFRYDHLRRLTNAWTPAAATWSASGGCGKDPAVDGLAGNAKYWHSYTYDKTGNRETETQHAAGRNTSRTYRYEVPGHAHAVSSVSTDGPGVSTRVDYTYEVTGATKTRTEAGREQRYTWDAEGRLATSTKDGATTSFVYNADGGRLIRRDPTSTTLYLGNQELVVNHAGGNPSVTRYYRHGGAVIAMRKGTGALTWLASDHQATAHIAINSETKQVSRRRQLPFGALRGTASAWPGERGFVGGTTDSSTGLVHLGAREYDPTTGRFISVDPIMNPADSQQLNGYTYSNNNPITFSDPTGLYCDSCDFYGRRDGTGSVWTPPPPNKPVISRTDQQVWRQEKGSRATTVKKPQPPKPKPKPASSSTPDCQASEGALYSGVALCDTKPNEQSKQAGYAFFGLCGLVKGPIGSGCDLLGTSLRGINGEEIDPWDLVPFGPNTSRLDAKKNAPRACSFTGDTKVVMADGSTKAIAEIKVGDRVLAADPETGKEGPRTVSDLIVHTDTVQDLVTEGGAKVTTTEDHLFWNATDKKWQRADHLDPGDSLFATTGESARVAGLRLASMRVDLAYNLTVDDLHTYHVLVGNTPVLVHNDCTFDVTVDGNRTTVTAKDKSVSASVDRYDDGGDLLVSEITILKDGASPAAHDNLADVLAKAMKDSGIGAGPKPKRITFTSYEGMEAGLGALRKLRIEPTGIGDNTFTRTEYGFDQFWIEVG